MKRRSMFGVALLWCAALTSNAPGADDRQANAALSRNRGPVYTLFESGQVRPLALSADHKTLFAVNTPDNRLEILKIDRHGDLRQVDSVTVGLEPVAVAVRSENEVWVVNHLSDSVSIVKLNGKYGPHVERTLLVGDEPRDIVFAGPNRGRAFITTAHRGQNTGRDPQLYTQGVGRADVWVFDADKLDDTLGGVPITVVTLFTDTPRALAVSPDGRTVYAAGLLTGNRTASISEILMPPGSLPGPRTNFQGHYQPQTGLIVKFNGSHWVDKQTSQIWDAQIGFKLPDKDVFAIDAMASPPAQLDGAAGFYTGVGTVLYNLAVNPISGKVYVSNTDALNDTRFSGPGIYGGSTVRGHMHENRITVLSRDGVAPRHLNKHIDYSKCCAAVPNPENERSLALPTGMEVSGDGRTLYVAAMGSSKVGIFDTAELENDTFTPSSSNHIKVSGGGPTGLVLDESRRRMYVMTRFDDGISTIDLGRRTEVAHLKLQSPEPASVIRGRRLLYDAAFTSSHGDSACASCHVFGDLDGLAWDLGNPDDVALENNMPSIPNNFPPSDRTFQPMKGPMVTQSLRGLANHGPMHWRGDRNGALDEPTNQPNGGQFNETLGFSKFNPAFVDLIGRDKPLSDAEMRELTRFVLQVTYPPNPIRNLDNSLTPDQAAGREHFFMPNAASQGHACVDCHALDPDANREFGVARPGFFGTKGELTTETFDPRIPQQIKIPHLRNIYQKVGKFVGGVKLVIPILEDRGEPALGDQIRGFGMLHDGSDDTVPRFLRIFGFSTLFNPNGFLPGPPGDLLRHQVEEFVMAFDSNMAPIVGQQVTAANPVSASARARIDLMMARAAATECDLVVKMRLESGETGFLYDNAGKFVPDTHGAPAMALEKMLRLASDAPVTFTCAPPGSGVRIGLDRDNDGIYDGDQRARRER